eukprot:GFYU01039261.1.p1 GENE.GFYU01039261.1~~GFYU01039261.1.p1  ORF type:complete len:388 (-),score=49.40 GFYU01039261.1:95-1258(-)
MADDNKSGIVGTHLRRLVQQTLTKDGQTPSKVRLEGAYQFSLRILGSRINPSGSGTVEQLQDGMKKHLVTNNNESGALKLERCCQKLSELTACRNKWAVLYLLDTLKDSDNHFTLGFSKIDPSSTSPGDQLKLRNISAMKSVGRSDPKSTRASRENKTKFGSEKENKDPFSDFQQQESTSFEISEAVLLRDILFVFQGVDGRYIKYNVPADTYTVDPTVGIPTAARHMVCRLCEVGWLYRKVRRYLEEVTKNEGYGLVGQSLAAALEKELREYYKLIAVLEAQLHPNGDRSAPSQLTLRRLLVWTYEPLQRLKLMAMLVDAAKDKKGGALASAIHSFRQHGDPTVRAFVQRIMCKVSMPIFNMMKRWVFEGEIEDPFHEFFVAYDRK